MFTKFYNQLEHYYNENGDVIKSSRCHTHILATIHDQMKDCSPDCDYLSISTVYTKIDNREQAFAFAELAYQHQWLSLAPMERAMLALDLYYGYMNPSLGSDETKASRLLATIIDEVYQYLISIAALYNYSEAVYYTAISIFQSKDMFEHVLRLQNQMIQYHKHVALCSEYNNCRAFKQGEYFDRMVSHAKTCEEDPTKLMSTCEFKCAAHYANLAQKAYNRECYHLAIWAGEQSSANLENHTKYLCLDQNLLLEEVIMNWEVTTQQH